MCHDLLVLNWFNFLIDLHLRPTSEMSAPHVVPVRDVKDRLGFVLILRKRLTSEFNVCSDVWFMFLRLLNVRWFFLPVDSPFSYLCYPYGCLHSVWHFHYLLNCCLFCFSVCYNWLLKAVLSRKCMMPWILSCSETDDAARPTTGEGASQALPVLSCKTYLPSWIGLRVWPTVCYYFVNNFMRKIEDPHFQWWQLTP